MPCLDGLTLACQIRKNDQQTLIIMMTSNILMGMLEEDFVDYVVDKPFKLNEIYAMLQNALEPKVQNYASFYQ